MNVSGGGVSHWWSFAIVEIPEESVTWMTPWMYMVMLLLVLPAAAQEIDLSGFVKSEYIYDTRQVAQVREGQFHLFPVRPGILHAVNDSSRLLP